MFVYPRVDILHYILYSRDLSIIFLHDSRGEIIYERITAEKFSLAKNEKRTTYIYVQFKYTVNVDNNNNHNNI